MGVSQTLIADHRLSKFGLQVQNSGMNHLNDCSEMWFAEHPRLGPCYTILQFKNMNTNRCLYKLNFQILLYRLNVDVYSINVLTERIKQFSLGHPVRIRSTRVPSRLSPSIRGTSDKWSIGGTESGRDKGSMFFNPSRMEEC